MKKFNTYLFLLFGFGLSFGGGIFDIHLNNQAFDKIAQLLIGGECSHPLPDQAFIDEYNKMGIDPNFSLRVPSNYTKACLLIQLKAEIMKTYFSRQGQAINLKSLNFSENQINAISRGEIINIINQFDTSWTNQIHPHTGLLKKAAEIYQRAQLPQAAPSRSVDPGGLPFNGNLSDRELDDLSLLNKKNTFLNYEYFNDLVQFGLSYDNSIEALNALGNAANGNRVFLLRDNLNQNFNVFLSRTAHESKTIEIFMYSNHQHVHNSGLFKEIVKIILKELNINDPVLSQAQVPGTFAHPQPIQHQVQPAAHPLVQQYAALQVQPAQQTTSYAPPNAAISDAGRENAKVFNKLLQTLYSRELEVETCASYGNSAPHIDNCKDAFKSAYETYQEIADLVLSRDEAKFTAAYNGMKVEKGDFKQTKKMLQKALVLIELKAQLLGLSNNQRFYTDAFVREVYNSDYDLTYNLPVVILQEFQKQVKTLLDYYKIDDNSNISSTIIEKVRRLTTLLSQHATLQPAPAQAAPQIVTQPAVSVPQEQLEAVAHQAGQPIPLAGGYAAPPISTVEKSQPSAPLAYPSVEKRPTAPLAAFQYPTSAATGTTATESSQGQTQGQRRRIRTLTTRQHDDSTPMKVMIEQHLEEVKKLIPSTNETVINQILNASKILTWGQFQALTKVFNSNLNELYQAIQKLTQLAQDKKWRSDDQFTISFSFDSGMLKLQKSLNHKYGTYLEDLTQYDLGILFNCMKKQLVKRPKRLKLLPFELVKLFV